MDIVKNQARSASRPASSKPGFLRLKAVRVKYQRSDLHGQLCLIDSTEYLKLYSRFMDILPSRKREEVPQNPTSFVLLHCIQGISWAPFELIDPLCMLGSNDDFVAFTDNPLLLNDSTGLGRILKDGLFKRSSPNDEQNDIIMGIQPSIVYRPNYLRDYATRPRSQTAWGEDKIEHRPDRYWSPTFGLQYSAVDIGDEYGTFAVDVDASPKASVSLQPLTEVEEEELEIWKWYEKTLPGYESP